MSNYSSSEFSGDPNTSWYKIMHLIEPKSKILDIGCSSGNFGDVLIKNKGCIVDGIELDHSDAQKAREKLRKVFELNIETDSLSQITDKYDYIYFGDVIEHLVDPSAALKRLQPLFINSKNAKILFSLPNMSHVSTRLMLLNGKFEYGKTGLLDNTHLHFYTLHELNRVFTKAGMEIGHFDPVIKDYPKSLLDTELSSVGLKNTDEFTKFINTTNASIYQLVGYAVYSGKPKKVPMEISSPRDTFATLLDSTVKYYEEGIRGNKEFIEVLEGRIKEQQYTIANQQTELSKHATRLHRRIYKKIKNMINE